MTCCFQVLQQMEICERRMIYLHLLRACLPVRNEKLTLIYLCYACLICTRVCRGSTEEQTAAKWQRDISVRQLWEEDELHSCCLVVLFWLMCLCVAARRLCQGCRGHWPACQRTWRFILWFILQLVDSRVESAASRCSVGRPESARQMHKFTNST